MLLECGITYSNALLVKCLDDLTDWVLYKQYLESCESEEIGTNRTAESKWEEQISSCIPVWR